MYRKEASLPKLCISFIAWEVIIVKIKTRYAKLLFLKIILPVLIH
jgi:hypothetical protein